MYCCRVQHVQSTTCSVFLRLWCKWDICISFCFWWDKVSVSTWPWRDAGICCGHWTCMITGCYMTSWRPVGDTGYIGVIGPSGDTGPIGTTEPAGETGSVGQNYNRIHHMLESCSHSDIAHLCLKWGIDKNNGAMSYATNGGHVGIVHLCQSWVGMTMIGPWSVAPIAMWTSYDCLSQEWGVHNIPPGQHLKGDPPPAIYSISHCMPGIITWCLCAHHRQPNPWYCDYHNAMK